MCMHLCAYREGPGSLEPSCCVPCPDWLGQGWSLDFSDVMALGMWWV